MISRTSRLLLTAFLLATTYAKASVPLGPDSWVEVQFHGKAAAYVLTRLESAATANGMNCVHDAIGRLLCQFEPGDYFAIQPSTGPQIVSIFLNYESANSPNVDPSRQHIIDAVLRQFVNSLRQSSSVEKVVLCDVRQQPVGYICGGHVLLDRKAMTSLRGTYAHADLGDFADRESGLSDGLNSSDILITERRGAFAILFSKTFPRLFESIARKHNMQCWYDPHINEVIRPPYPTLACGPKHIPLVLLQPIWDRRYYVFQSAWFEAACKPDHEYTMEQLKTMADSFSEDFKSALARNERVAKMAFGHQKDSEFDTMCPNTDVPADIVE